MNFSKLASKEVVNRTIAALAERNISAEVVETKEEAKSSVLSLVPHGAEVFTMTSVTLAETGIDEEINSSGNYVSVRAQLNQLDRKTDSLKMQKLGAAPEWTIGSVHAVTEDGQVVIASNTGSQLPAYAYGAAHVIWVVSTKKIVENLDSAMKRIEEFIVPLENERGKKAYGMPEFKTNVSKLLIINKEVVPGRVHIIFVNEELGF